MISFTQIKHIYLGYISLLTIVNCVSLLRTIPRIRYMVCIMLSIVIVEDEYRISRMLKRMIEKDSEHFEVIGSASDGLSGIDLIQALHPNIVITDIKMAGCSGIDLITKIKAEYPDTDFVIISGYRYFDNAYKAIQIGVKHFLLKPIEEEELFSVLNSIADSRSSEKKKQQYAQEIQKKISVQSSYLRSNFVTELWHVHSSSFLDIDSVNDHNQCQFKAGSFQSLIVSLNTNLKSTTQEQNLFLQKITNVLEHLLEPYLYEQVSSIQNNSLIAVINYPNDSYEKIYQVLTTEFVAEANQLIRKFGPYSIAVGIGMEKDNISLLKDSMNEARLALRNRLIPSTNQSVYLYKQIKSQYPTSDFITNNDKSSLLGFVKSCDLPSIKKWVSGLSSTFETVLSIDASCVFDLSIYISNLVKSFVWDNLNLDIQDKAADFELRLEASNSIPDILTCLEDYLSEIAEFYVENTVRNEPHIIQEAKDYISKNFANPIKLDEVAAAVHLSPTYFSSLFKQVTGSNFIDYLIQVRIDEAKMLLRTTNNSIPSIAALCGYSDDKYFSQQFKKIVGLRPTAYRKLYH